MLLSVWKLLLIMVLKLLEDKTMEDDLIDLYRSRTDTIIYQLKEIMDKYEFLGLDRKDMIEWFIEDMKEMV